MFGKVDYDSKNLLIIALTAIIYFFAARWGLQVGAVNIFATLVWPATGISLAILLLCGEQVWPGVALGAFSINYFLSASIPVALGIATGNTLEALIGVYLLKRAGFRPSLERIHDVFALIVLAAAVSTLFSSIIGVASLYFFGNLSSHDLYPTWIAWWFGDILGDLLVAPFILVWSQKPHFIKTSISHAFEIVILLSMVLVGSLINISSTQMDSHMVPKPHPYLIFPLVMILAVRLNQKWTMTAVLMIAIAVISITTTEQGPFWLGSLSQSLLEAQIFLAVLAISKMVLSATVMERKMREREANEAIQARDEFLSIASHELRTPLTSLFLQLQLFNRSVKKSLETESNGSFSFPTQATKNIFATEAQARKLASLLNDLLDLTRIRLGKLKLERERVDLCSLVNEVADRFRAEMAATTATISVECRSPVEGDWDRSRIEQVVSNLISNALKYGEGKPISIFVENNDSQVVKLTVKDHGMGIPADLNDKIFERFERGRIRGNQISGLGLGLYICRQIVEAHGGRVGVESEMGKGSVFWVELAL